MHLNPYGEYAVRMAVDLVNDPPATVADFEQRCLAAGMSDDTVSAHTDLGRARAFLTEWLGVVDAPTDTRRAEALNALLAQTSAYPRLTDHAGDGWHLHYRDPDLPLADVVRALVSVGTALHLVGRGMHRLGRCAAADCTRVYADFSRTGRQRYCGTVCSNRDAVRRHRARA
ncbi:CGNR zinc finger domain-containing protein [Rhodococcoides kroppenstedtii]|uniref:CGNR zinc finger domain-containing protein n=1 Tax=Rhodococcoides kroppenstedtii TaxID=293050 RepID=A0A1I0TYC0_9NOCA|nr:CGNR zinc finger domain-containing protein [Rhodococcus kroppenstedtii]SFA56899.1 CGNR zinc finger domain-containing protein [Rhodococcus kroppenstedtii]